MCQGGPAVISLVKLLHNVWSYAVQSEISLIKITDVHVSNLLYDCIPPNQTWQHLPRVLQKNQWCTCLLVIHPFLVVVLGFRSSQASSWTAGRIKLTLNKAGRLGNMILACSLSLWQSHGRRELKTFLETGELSMRNHINDFYSCSYRTGQIKWMPAFWSNGTLM